MKRKVSLFLTIVMLLSLIPVNVFSVRANTQIGLTKDVVTTEFVHLTEVPDGYVGIYTKSDLDNIRNDLSGNYILMNDIEFSDDDFSENGQFYNNGSGWSSIGNSETPFIGTFDGNGYCVNGLSISGSITESPYVGLFGYNKGCIKNVTLIGQITITHASNTAYVGMIAGYSEGTIENCKSVGDISVESTILRATYETPYSYVGGITGCSVGTLSLCENTCDIQATPSVIAYAEAVAYLGGIAGIANSSTILNCINSGTITLTLTLDANTGITVYAGGVSGQSNSNTTGCDNTGSVVIEEFKASSTSNVSISAKFYVAGIIGYSTGTITGSNNAGTVRARGVYAYSGGIAGYNTGTLSQCSNIGNIMAITTSTGSAEYSYGYSGGIAGYSTGTTSESYNTGFVEVNEAGASEVAYSGGIVSYQKGGTITNCYNAGYVPDKTYYGDTGGIAGYSTGSISLCYNIGRVPEGFPSGGGAIVGYTSQITPNCFFLDDNKVGVAEGKDSTISCSKEALLLAETYTGFDFNSVWEIGIYDTYPSATLKNVEHKGSKIGKDLFAGGTGTAYDPFLIENAEQLNNVRVIPSAYYKLIADITFKDSDYAEGGTFYNGGEGWLPIMYFVGSFDGSGHVINNLQIYHAPTSTVSSYSSSNAHYARYYADCFGLFGFNCGGTISRVGVTGNIYVKKFNRPSLLDYAYVGGIAGKSNGTISECYFIGSVYGTAEYASQVGGICGWSWDPEGTLENCFTKGTFTGPTTNVVGGITGGGSYSNCYSIGCVVKKGSYSNIAIVRGSGDVVNCTDAEMRTQSTYTEFDFNSVWTMEYSDCYVYPQLTSVLYTSGHKYGEWYETQAPTCTATGTDEHECSVCHSKEIRTTAALGHTNSAAVIENKLDATCTVDGSYDSVIYCSVCDAELLREAKNIPILGHDMQPSAASAPTCTNSGVTAGTKCSRCEYSTVTVIPALTHDISKVSAKPATCTEIGWNEYEKCSRCDYTTYVELPALNHDLTQVPAKPATCTEIGWNEYEKCSRCEYTTYVELPALKHNLTKVPAKPASCTEIGWNEYEKCSRCEYTTYVELPALKHELTKVPARPATCTEIGWNEYEKCSRCDYTTYVEIPALKHELTKVPAKPATCTEIGWNEYEKCSRCEYTTYVEIPMVQHKYTSVIIKPQLGVQGYTLHTCSVCGDSFKDNYTDALTYIYGDTNGDGIIDGRDVLLLRQYMAALDYDTGISSVEVHSGADANGDGVINGRDVLLLRKYMANYDYDAGSSTVVLGPLTK